MATPWNCFVSDIPGANDVATIKCLEPLFANIVAAIVAISGVGLFFMTISSGFTYLFSGGDPKKLEKAKGTLTNSIVGLVVIVSAYLLIRTIETFTGMTTLTTFTIPQ